MFTTEMVSFLQSGCALVVGTVGEDGVPLASRGWGLDVDAGERSARLLLPAVDPALRNTISRDSRIAVTATNVRTLRSVQLKGLVRDVEPVTEADRERFQRYCNELFGDIAAADHGERVLIERLAPGDVVACGFTVDEVFDQTPGPAAGTRLDGEDP